MTNKNKRRNTIRSWMGIRELLSLIFTLMMVAVLTHGSPAFFQKANFLSRACGFSIEGITLIATTIKIELMTPEMEKGIPDPTRFLPLTPGYGGVLFYHERAADAQDQWKRMDQGHYVLECGPSNSRVDGRNVDRACGTLQVLQSLECCEDCLEIGVLYEAQEIHQSVHKVSQLQGT